MQKRSEGVRRIVFLFSILSAICWISWVAIATDGFHTFQANPVVWVGFAVQLFIAYFIPQLICKVAYWVIGGFGKDKET